MTVDEELTDFLGSHITENKREKIASVLAERTRRITVLLEDIYQPHNASACLRSCDCLGIQDVHIVENRNDYRPNNNVSMGSTKWLSLKRYDRTHAAVEALQSGGYRLIATSPNLDGYDLNSLPIDQPVALLFGSEQEGLSPQALSAAEGTLRIPMYGFTESFNISVTLSLALHSLVTRLRASDIDWKLSEAEQKELTLRFYRRVVTRSDLLEDKFHQSRTQ
jgi:tRNA (guanosine-2'-O-)-methyltransferase